jgi:hypothetical protein
VRPKVEYMYLESPICNDSNILTPAENVNRFFRQCSALHILEVGWTQLMDMLPEFILLEQFSVPYIIESSPSYPSFTDKSFPKPDVEKSGKTFYLSGKMIKCDLAKGYGIHLPGRGIIRYDSPRNNGGVRCLQKTEVAEAEAERVNLKLETKKFIEGIKAPLTPYAFKI